MSTDLLERESESTTTVSKKKKLTSDQLLGFISGCQSNIGRTTFYNLAEEQKKAMISQHEQVFKNSRFFYSLMMLPEGVNDVNKQLMALNLIRNTLREEGLKDHQADPTTQWENEIMLQIFNNMPIPRVFDFFLTLQEGKINKKRAVYVVRRFLNEHKDSWGLWAIKYRTPMNRILRHIHVKKSELKLSTIHQYIRMGVVDSNTPDVIRNYEKVRNGDSDLLASLPYTVAEGFQTKFGLSKEEFDKLFVKKGGKFTAKEKRLKSKAVEKSGESTGLDISKLKLFDLIVHISAQSRLPDTVTNIKKLISKQAKKVARTLSFDLKDVGVILDTSLSMYGTKQNPNHPLYKGMALSAVFKEASKGTFKEYRTNPSTGLIPSLKNQSNYADSVLQALKDGCKTIVIIGDGYENAPYEGATHNILYTYKKKLDPQNELVVLHLNPVFASESLDSRNITSLAPQIGVKGIEGLNESMFLAIARNNPKVALEGYARHLVEFQNEKAKAIMPVGLKELLADKNKKLTA